MVLDWLDILTTILGLIYIWLEYRAHIALWVIGIVMPAWTSSSIGSTGSMVTQEWLVTTPLQPATDSLCGSS